MILKDFLAFDVETATNHRYSICQLGFAKVRNQKIIESKSFLIKPPNNEYIAGNSNKHGISAYDTKDKEEFPAIWDIIKHDFISNTLVAHNAAFDIDALNKTLDYYGLENPKFKCLCTYQQTNLSLKNLCQALSINLDHHHNALHDAIACAEVLITLQNGGIIDENLIVTEEPKDYFGGHGKLKGDVLRPNLDVEDKNNPFYGKKVVLTGELKSYNRKDAAQILKDKGADIDTNVTKRTNYVILGAGAGPTKLKRINEYNSKGSEIEILNEEQFLKMINPQYLIWKKKI